MTLTAWEGLVVAICTVGGFGWTVRTGIRRDRAERARVADKARADEITLAIDAALEHQKMLATEAENADLRRRLGESP